ncbi:MAG TPA: serine hydrolase domain-containing protein [Polyangiaceae bacterium]|nr:serine hydrolase domain-containing protein [Polyangiaceae bacterium]
MTQFHGQPARGVTCQCCSALWVLFGSALLALACGGSPAAEAPFVVPVPETAPEDAIAAFLDKGGLPALMVGVVDGGQTLLGEVRGVRKRGDGTPVMLDDAFHIGSNTKAMTALLAGTVVDAGQLGWDTTVGGVLTGTVPVGDAFRGVTLAQLLNHSSGLPAHLDPSDEQSFEGSTEPVEAERRRMAELVLALPQPKESIPGKYFQYSNYNFVVAGVMLEVATGKSWETLIAERLFAPLGMTHAGFGSPATPGLVDAPWGHDPSPVDPGLVSGVGPEAYGPAGTVHANLADLLAYVQLYFDPGVGHEQPILSQAALDEIETPRLHHYGFGWFVGPDENGELVLWHNGSNGSFYSTLVLFPARRGALIMVTNDGSNASWRRIAELDGYLAAHFGLPQQRPNL